MQRDDLSADAEMLALIEAGRKQAKMGTSRKLYVSALRDFISIPASHAARLVFLDLSSVDSRMLWYEQFDSKSLTTKPRVSALRDESRDPSPIRAALLRSR